MRLLLGRISPLAGSAFSSEQTAYKLPRRQTVHRKRRLLSTCNQDHTVQTIDSVAIRCSATCTCTGSSSCCCCTSSNSTGNTRVVRAALRATSICSSSMYDNAAIYSNDDAFSERLYWDKRYQQDPTTFEWYRSYDSLAPILTRHLPKHQHILQLGVGTSRIQEDMADDGYSSITSIDYSPVAIQRLQQTYPSRPGLVYAVGDARAMPQYGDSSCGGMLDKGTLDALLCGDDDDRAAAQLLGEVWRLLVPGGAYVMITSAGPRGRLGYLQTAATPWQQLLVYEVGQQGAMTGPYSCSSGSEGSAVSSSGTSGAGLSKQPGTVDGSAEQQQAAAAAPAHSSAVDQLAAAMALPKMGYSHMVYVCCKP